MTTDSTLLPHSSSPLLQRLLRWSDERFPLSHGLLFAAMYGATLLVAASSATEAAVTVGASDIAGFFALWCFFGLLRVFDEHKDYELDCLNHPERVLQSGQISLAHLRGVGGVATLLMLAASLYADRWQIGAVTQAWLLVMIWSGLMAREFFIGDWLQRHLVLYATSHMAVMPLVAIWVAAFGGPSNPATLAALGAMLFFGGATFEVTRKTRGPEEEREHVDSYSKVFGPRAAAVLALIGFALSTACQLTLVTWLGGTVGWWQAALCLPLVAVQLSLMLFMAKPSEPARERNEAVVALSMIAGYAVVIAFVVTQRGLAWS